MSHWSDVLAEIGACRGAQKFCREYRTFGAALRACDHADWFLWLMNRLKLGPYAVTSAGGCTKAASRAYRCLDRACVCEEWVEGWRRAVQEQHLTARKIKALWKKAQKRRETR